MAQTEVEFSLKGERLVARGDRSLWWPERATLFVADVHLGKAAAFGAAGLPLPAGTSNGTLAALSRALDETGAHRLTILGDLWHARRGRTPDEVARFAAWRQRHVTTEMVLIEGNHDQNSGPLPSELAIATCAECVEETPFRLAHHPEASPDGYVLAGHLHPGAVLEGSGQRLKLPCFWFGPEVGILPAFGEFTGLAAIRPSRQDQVFVVADGKVVPMGLSSRVGERRGRERR